MAMADVGVFATAKAPPLVPDVLVSVDVGKVLTERKETHSYFVWVVGKVPDIVIEIVSNKEGGEDTTKVGAYAKMRIPYYVIFDPSHFLSAETLRVFSLGGSRYVRNKSGRMPDLNLGVRLWRGGFESLEAEWVRFTDATGRVIACGNEKAIIAQKRADVAEQRATVAEQRADTAKKRADAEKRRAERLAEKLKSLGIEPE